MRSSLPTWGALVFLLTLTGCASKPIELPPPPSVPPPAIPVSALVKVPPPPPPTPLAGMPPEEQARILSREYADALGWGAELHLLREDLIEWALRMREYLQEGPNGRR